MNLTKAKIDPFRYEGRRIENKKGQTRWTRDVTNMSPHYSVWHHDTSENGVAVTVVRTVCYVDNVGLREVRDEDSFSGFPDTDAFVSAGCEATGVVHLWSLAGSV